MTEKKLKQIAETSNRILKDLETLAQLVRNSEQTLTSPSVTLQIMKLLKLRLESTLDVVFQRNKIVEKTRTVPCKHCKGSGKIYWYYPNAYGACVVCEGSGEVLDKYYEYEKEETDE